MTSLIPGWSISSKFDKYLLLGSTVFKVREGREIRTNC